MITKLLCVMQVRNSFKMVKINKTEQRKRLKNYLIDEAQKALEQNYLLETLWNLVKSHNPNCVGLYATIENEVDLTNIFEKCQKHNILVAYPRITNDQITFHYISSKSELILGYGGIHEPSQSAPVMNPDFLVVPGLAFTLNGQRLGRGKGHYDKYLNIHCPYTVGLAFSWQLLDDVPTEPHDVKIDQIINFKKLT